MLWFSTTLWGFHGRGMAVLWGLIMVVLATGAVNGPAGFAVFFLSHCTSVKSIAR